MKFLTANSNWLEGNGQRLDASYHLSDGRLSKVKINKCPYKVLPLQKVTKSLYNGARFKRIYVRDKAFGVPFMGSSDMLKSDVDNLKYISKKLSKNIDSLQIEKNWILVSCSGTIGNTVYTNNDYHGKTASQHVMRIIPNDSKIKPGYLYAYLSSVVGYSLLTQGTYGAVIQHIEPHHIEDLPVPIFPEVTQKKIHELIVEASELRVEANELLRNAIVEIEKKNSFIKQVKTFSTSIKDIHQGDKYTKECRLETDYYQPSTRTLIEDIKKDNWAYLGDLSLDIHRSGLRDRVFVKKGVPLITGQNLNMGRLENLKVLSKKFTRNIEKNTTEESDVLVTVLGTVGKVEYVYRNMYQGVFASEHMSKIKIDSSKVHPGYIAAYLNSKAGFLQLMKHKTGSVIEWIKENNIASIVVPIPEDKGANIGERVNVATLKRQEAFEKENKAIELVEKEMESWQG